LPRLSRARETPVVRKNKRTMKTLCLITAFASAPVHAVSTESRVHANPIRKVVTMLQSMSDKVLADGERETKLHEKFMCYCKSANGGLDAGISEAAAKIPQLESSIEEGTGKKAQFASDIQGHKTDRDSAKSAVAEATEIRAKEKAAFDKEKDEDSTDLAATQRASKALMGGMGGAFLQSPTAGVLRRLVSNKEDMNSADREDVLSFLSADSDNGEGDPGSMQIIGILNTMADEMSKEIAEAEDEEAKAISDFQSLVGAKKKEINALSKMIEQKLQRVGDLAVEITQNKNDLAETKDVLAEDSKFAGDLKASCSTKEDEWDVVVQTRQEEVTALAETVKILNDDDALEMFKKTLPGAGAASFMQIQVTSAEMRSSALDVLRSSNTNHPGIDVIMLALGGKTEGFKKVIGYVDKLVAQLNTEQKDDDDKKVYCATEFDVADDKKKSTEHDISDIDTAVAKAEEAIAGLGEDIASLTDGIKALDASVTQSTEQRKQENSDYTELMANDNTAKQVIEFAKNRLNKFYNPKLYKAPAPRELTEEQRITLSMGGTLAPTAAPGGIAGTGIGASFLQMSARSRKAAPPPPPESFGAYAKKSEESGGVLQMMDLLVKDLEKEMAGAGVDEKNAQADYEKFLADAAAKRAKDSKLVGEKEGAKAEAQASLEGFTEDKVAATKELGATVDYIQSLHHDCDFLVKFFGLRKQARDSELDALTKSKAVLSGADYSFLQVGKSKRHFLRA